MASRLGGRNCLIVGGTSGIGLASARRFLDEKARVVVAGLETEEALAAVAELAPRGSVWFVAADVRNSNSVAALFQATLEHLGGRLDVLFHVAGISGRKFGDGLLHDCTGSGWDEVMSVNALGAFLTNREAVKVMRQQAVDVTGLRGTVLNMGSVVDVSPAPKHFGTIAYAASKGAVRALTLAAAACYAPERIRFNLLAPGLIDTPMAARAVGDPVVRSYLQAKQPIAGGPGTVDDVAEAALFLCEPASRFVTGTVVTIDGGWCVSEGPYEGGTSP